MNFQILTGIFFAALIGSVTFGRFLVEKFWNIRKIPKIKVAPWPYEIFQLGDHVEMMEDAKEVLGLELIEMHGKGPFVVVGVGEADEILKNVHPQFLFLRRSGDPMVIGVRFSGAQFRKIAKHKASESAKSAKPTQRSRPARIRI